MVLVEDADLLPVARELLARLLRRRLHSGYLLADIGTRRLNFGSVVLYQPGCGAEAIRAPQKPRQAPVLAWVALRTLWP